MSETKYTFCRICEATCGLVVEVDDNRITSIRPDHEHVVSQGYACVKGTRWDSLQHSPDRVTQPQKRVAGRFIEISWEQALSEIAEKIAELIGRHGPDTLGHFAGSAAGANMLSPIFRAALFAGLGSRRMYGTGTCDTMNKFRVNEDMYGSPMRLAYPDVDRCEFMLVLGANPAISGGTLYHLPRSKERFKAVVKRGGRVVFINPRRIETAQAGEHLFIRPDTDLYFLAAFCNELIQRGHAAAERIQRSMINFDVLSKAVAPWTPERQALVTGISAESLRGLVRDHAAAKGAALNMATGVNQGRSGTLCFWLLECINAISGNLDRVGGTLMGEGLIDMAKQVTEDPQMMLSRDRRDDLPTVAGQQPSGMLAADILDDPDAPLRALIVEASNPLLACSNPSGRLDRALGKLELLVSIDLFRNETGDLAHYVLPAPTWMERPEIPYALQSFAGCCPTPYMIYSDAVLEPPPGVRHEWWIFTRLADKLGVTLFNNRLGSLAAKLMARAVTSPIGRFVSPPRIMINGMLKKAGLPGCQEMSEKHPHGLLLPQNDGNNFLDSDRVLTPDGKINLGPADFAASFDETADQLYAEELANLHRMKLIGKREMRRLNTFSSNSKALVKERTNYVYMNPEDAARIGVTNDDAVEVESAHGKIEIPVRVSDEMMLGTIAIPQCWGHKAAGGLKHAASHPGVNSNLLAGDGYENIERLSGMSHLAGIFVDVRSVAQSSRDRPQPELGAS